MGTLVPADLPLSSLANDDERRVVAALCEGLSDGWLVLPHVQLRGRGRDHELDVVLVHPDHGVADIEVKGHPVQVREGLWCGRDGRPIEPQPFDQARTNAYALRDELRAAASCLRHLHVEHAVALPNTSGFDGDLPPGCERVQVLTAADLLDVSDAVVDLMSARWSNQRLTTAQVEAIVGHLRPDAAFRWDPAARMRQARHRLDELGAEQVRVLERLDANRRVVGVGAAGTGKTRLADAWARRAYLRGERVLLTCYNEPLADQIRDRAAPHDESLVIGPFLRLALGFEGMPPVEVPDDADHEWWTITAVGHLVTHFHEVTERFDTIVVDEAQDFSPAWLALLETLLDPDGPRRMLIVADEAQELYQRGFAVPPPEDGWVRCELVSNCRNSQQIARLLRRRLHGAPSPAVGPESVDLRWVPVDPGDPDAVVHAVVGELGRLLDDEERSRDQVAVLTVASTVRDRLLRTGPDLVRWEHRADGVLVENVHRVKGLEFDTVVLVSDTDDVPEDLLYVGVGRAVGELVVIGPEGLATRLGLCG